MARANTAHESGRVQQQLLPSLTTLGSLPREKSASVASPLNQGPPAAPPHLNVALARLVDASIKAALLAGGEARARP